MIVTFNQFFRQHGKGLRIAALSPRCCHHQGHSGHHAIV